MIIRLGTNAHVFDKNTGERIKESEIENYAGTNIEQTVRRAYDGSIILSDANTDKEIRTFKQDQNIIEEPVLHNGKQWKFGRSN